jgi:CSLREA domain-containing protein
MKIGYTFLAAICSLALFAVSGAPTYAGTFTVTKTADDAGACTESDCSLRAAIIAANATTAEDTIAIPSGRYTLDIPNTANDEDSAATGDLDITQATIIEGSGMRTTIVDGGSIDRVFEFTNASATASLSRMTIQNGVLTNSGTDGGGIYNNTDLTVEDTLFSTNTAIDEGGAIYVHTTAELEITNSIIDSNNAAYGGGISVRGTTQLTRVTLSYNTASIFGGGIRNIAELTVVNTTIASNSARKGGAYYGAGSTAANVEFAHATITGNTATETVGGFYGGNTNLNYAMQNSIIAENSDNGTAPDCYFAESVASYEYNLIGDTTGCDDFILDGDADLSDMDPEFNSSGLGTYGGTTNVIAITAASPAKDWIPVTACTDVDGAAIFEDQRGYARPEENACDIGAYELDQTDPTIALDGDNPTTFECGETYTDAGATVTDNWDDSISAEINENGLDTGAVGSYALIYTATDDDGNSDTALRSVAVVDTAAPTIALVGDTTVALTVGDTYAEEGATGTDTCTESVTVAIDGTVNTAAAGTYIITYTATDTEENSSSTTRTVIVNAAVEVIEEDVDEEEEVVAEEVEEDAVDEEDGEDDEERGISSIRDVEGLSNGRIQVTRGDDSVVIIQAFNGSKKPKTKLSTDGLRIIAVNGTGKKLKAFDSEGSLLDSMHVRKTTQTAVRLKVFNFYNDANDEIVIVTQEKKKLKTTVVTLQNNNALTSKHTQTHKPFTATEFTIEKKKKNIRVMSQGVATVKYRVLRNGNLR